MIKKDISSYEKPSMEIMVFKEDLDVVTLSEGENLDTGLWPADANSIQN